MRGPWHFEEPRCAEIGTEFFYPNKNETSVVRMAVSICNLCTHKTECLEWALANEEHGIWGGTNGNQRTRIKRLRRKKVA